MDAKELRVGNWIEEEYNNFRQWRLEDYSLYHGEDYPENEISDKISPIPLTSEILEQCGFKKGSLGFWMKGGVEYNPNKHLLLGFGYCEVNHLHQLQNLFFALTGEELELKPAKEVVC